MCSIIYRIEDDAIKKTEVIIRYAYCPMLVQVGVRLRPSRPGATQEHVLRPVLRFEAPDFQLSLPCPLAHYCARVVGVGDLPDALTCV